MANIRLADNQSLPAGGAWLRAIASVSFPLPRVTELQEREFRVRVEPGRPDRGDEWRFYDRHQWLTPKWLLRVTERPLGSAWWSSLTG